MHSYMMLARECLQFFMHIVAVFGCKTEDHNEDWNHYIRMERRNPSVNKQTCLYNLPSAYMTWQGWLHGLQIGEASKLVVLGHTWDNFYSEST